MKLLGLVVLSICIGCGGGSTAPAAPSNQDPGAPAGPAAATPPEGSKFACHLNCSGQEKHGYGVTEEEANANARKLVESTCNPDDGQHFIVCNPIP